MHGDASSTRRRARALTSAAGLLLVGLLAARGVPAADRAIARSRDRRRREVVGGRHQRVAPHAARPGERAVRDRPPRQHGRQPGAAAAALDEGPLRLVRGALPARVPRRHDPRRLGPRPDRSRGGSGTTLREAALHAGASFFPPSGKTPGPDALHAPAVQHLDRAHLRPEPAGRARLRARDRRQRLPAGGADDRRGLVRRATASGTSTAAASRTRRR